MTITMATIFRYMTLQVFRTLGGMYSWLRTEWRPPIIWLIVTALIVCLPTGTLLTRVKQNCRGRWYALAQANAAGVARQEVGARPTSRSNSACA